jgi:hypothetical protein
MADIVERLIEVAKKNYPGCEVKVKWDKGLEKVVGFILWDGFAEMDHVSRQGGLYDVLDRELGPDAEEVSLLLTYTPKEYNTLMAA